MGGQGKKRAQGSTIHIRHKRATSYKTINNKHEINGFINAFKKKVHTEK
jgi:hypothetical protein